MTPSLQFSGTTTYEQLEQASAQELDQADFGIIRLSQGGEVMYYNQYESDLSGVAQSDAVGKQFFTQIAPCTNNFMVAAKYEQPTAILDETLPYVFTYNMAPTKVHLRLLAQPAEAHAYLLVQKD
ncbi:MAG: PAS domain-containing protein [Bacteroidota bacterium]